MDIFNYAQKLVTELGERNPVQRVVSDVSTFFMTVKTKKEERKKGVALNPIIGKSKFVLAAAKLFIVE
ncbi:hypothetical protein SUGI_0928990 [Cryptomeria japonica]|nr:hypothetical protein SUGI_0928990 [Cryptomeria japonica]